MPICRFEMMMKMYVASGVPVLLAFAVILFAAGPSEAVECYVCNSATSSNCGENNFNHLTHISDTKSGCNVCAKVIGSAGVSSVTRSCVDVCPSFNLNLFGARIQVECCSTWRCNSATNFRSVAAIVVGLVAAAFLLKM